MVQTYSFKTYETNSFNFLLMGDPQIGSGEVSSDTTGWANTLNKAYSKYSNASFILSVGDQIKENAELKLIIDKLNNIPEDPDPVVPVNPEPTDSEPGIPESPKPTDLEPDEPVNPEPTDSEPEVPESPEPTDSV